jgi:hypothetical protein
VVGSFRGADVASASRQFRDPPPLPSERLVQDLIVRTGGAMDSVFGRSDRGGGLYPRKGGRRIALNALEEVDAADVLPFRVDGSRVRYAVALRERRRSIGGEDLLAATLMVWDSAGGWRQFVFHPALPTFNRGAPGPGSYGPPVYWRRMEAVSEFAFERDYIWLEQVNVQDGSILWTVMEPSSNTVVAAAEVAGPCD